MILIEEFDAEDVDGARYRLHIWQDMPRAGNLTTPQRRVAGRKAITLSNGEPVNPLDDGRFMVVNSGTILTRLD